MKGSIVQLIINQEAFGTLRWEQNMGGVQSATSISAEVYDLLAGIVVQLVGHKWPGRDCDAPLFLHRVSWTHGLMDEKVDR